MFDLRELWEALVFVSLVVGAIFWGVRRICQTSRKRRRRDDDKCDGS